MADTKVDEVQENIFNKNVVEKSSSENSVPSTETEPISYNISLKIPGLLESINFKVDGNQQTIELKQVVLDLYEPTMRTCFSLKMDKSEQIDDSIRIRDIPKMHDEAVFKIEDEPYNHREVLFHINRLRELLYFDSNQNAFTGNKNCSISAFSQIFDSLEKYSMPDEISIDKLNFKLDVTNHLEKLLKPCLDQNISQTGNISFKMSSFNPPVGQRRLCGDIMYLDVITYEKKYYCVTCSRNGFFVNRSTQDEFNFLPSTDNLHAYTLVLLFSKLSKSFKDFYSKRLNKLKIKNPYEIEATPVQVYSWFAPEVSSRKDDFEAFESGLGVDFLSSISSTSSQTRDWNEELQEIRELSKNEKGDQFMRDRSLFRFYSDLIDNIKKTTLLISQGYVVPVNPKESPKYHMYFWNNIFYSYSVDAKNVFQKYGGDLATEKLALLEVAGYEKFSQYDPDNLHSVVTVVVDYFGKRLIAQTFVPGILRKSLEDGVIHGSIDFGKSIKKDEEFYKRCTPFFEELKIKPAKYLDKDGNEVELPSSIEVKGALGSDGRYYCLDMFRMSPPDFLFIEKNDENVKSIDSKLEFATDLALTLTDKYEFPAERFNNKMCAFRDRLFDQFLTVEYLKFLNIYKEKLETLKKDKPEDINDDDKSELEKLAMKEALVESRSSSEDRFDIKINPDCMLTHLNRPDSEKDSILIDKFNCYRIGSFLVGTYIPKLIEQIKNEFILDGFALTDFFHNNGINMRYLGYFTAVLNKAQPNSHIYNICISEIFIRSIKQHFKNILKNVGISQSALFISHYLNCFLSSDQHSFIKSQSDNSSNSKNFKKKFKSISITSSSFDAKLNNEWTKLTTQSVWQSVRNIALSKFNIDISCKSVYDFVRMYEIGPLQLLKRFASVTGIQIKSRNYDFNRKKSFIFALEDILNVFPVIKYPKHIPSYAYNLFMRAKDLMKLGQKHYHECLNLLNLSVEVFLNIYGIIHPLIAECYTLIGDLYNVTSSLELSNDFYSKALVIYERIYGIDHYMVAKSYYRIGVNLFHQNYFVRSLILLERARDIIFTSYGKNFPEVSNIYTIFGLILAKCKRDHDSLEAHKTALEISLNYDKDQKSLNLGLEYFVLAKQQVTCSKFKDAVSSAKESLRIVKESLGVGNSTTAEISSFLDYAIKLAVLNEKSLREPSVASYDKLKAELANLITISGSSSLPFNLGSASTSDTSYNALNEIKKPLDPEIPLD